MGQLVNMCGGAVFLAAASQFPEYSQQYVQRLGGAVDELRLVVADFDKSAAGVGLSRDAALASMTGNDFRPNRITVAKQLTKEFIASRPNDRIGLVAFSGRPYPVGPLTLQHDWLYETLDDLELGYEEPGTAIGSAIASAASRIDKRDAKSKIIVLITDGANNVRTIEPLDAARAAALLGIKVYTIAIGTSGEIIIQAIGPFGNKVAQRMNGEFDVETLIEVANLTDGKFYKAGSSQSLADAFDTINKLEKTTQTTTTVYRVRELFHWFAMPALAALVIGTIFPPLDERAATFPRLKK